MFLFARWQRNQGIIFLKNVRHPEKNSMLRPSRSTLCSLVIVLGSLAAVQAVAQTQAPAPASSRAERVAALLPEIDKHYTELAAKEHLPGVVVGVVLDGKLVHVRSLGLADVERKIPVTASTEFRIASMTKSFVAMAALKLRDAGKLRLDDPVTDYLPELRKLALPTTDSPALTIRQLMTMSSGL